MFPITTIKSPKTKRNETKRNETIRHHSLPVSLMSCKCVIFQWSNVFVCQLQWLVSHNIKSNTRHTHTHTITHHNHTSLTACSISQLHMSISTINTSVQMCYSQKKSYQSVKKSTHAHTNIITIIIKHHSQTAPFANMCVCVDIHSVHEGTNMCTSHSHSQSHHQINKIISH